MSAQGILTHYTDSQGLLGILQSRSLWATEIRFLNDTSEFSYAVQRANGLMSSEPVQDAVAALKQRNPKMGMIPHTGRQPISESIDSQIFVTSFSTKPDDLSQWRGYTTTGNGYAIDFDSALLAKAAADVDWRLAQVDYGGDEAALVDHLVRSFSPWLDPGFPSDTEQYIRTALALPDKLIGKVAPTIKHPAFDSECEWRLISPYEGVKVSHRLVRATLVPYTVFPFDIEAVRALRIGPGSTKDAARSSLTAILEDLDLRLEITESQIPYR